MIRNRISKWRSRATQRGATAVELIVTLPVVGLVGLAALQFGLVMQQKNALNYALQEAVRAGSVGHATPDAIESGLARGLMPVLVGATNEADAVTALVKTKALIAAGKTGPQQYLSWQQLSPSQQAFDDFGVTVNGQKQIPNDNLGIRDHSVGASSGQTILDANVLKVKMVYGVPLNVPLVGTMAATLVQAFGQGDPLKAAMLQNNRMPIEFVYAARMQSAAYPSGEAISHQQSPRGGSSLGTGNVDAASQFDTNLPASYASAGSGSGTGAGGSQGGAVGIHWGDGGNDGTGDTGGTGNTGGLPGGGGGSCDPAIACCPGAG
ncbi:MAG: pilus assembly protein [Burkholderiales bacterium]|nr:pilus assembly protein [Burkholderiales bacterium]